MTTDHWIYRVLRVAAACVVAIVIAVSARDVAIEYIEAAVDQEEMRLEFEYDLLDTIRGLSEQLDE